MKTTIWKNIIAIDAPGGGKDLKLSGSRFSLDARNPPYKPPCGEIKTVDHQMMLPVMMAMPR